MSTSIDERVVEMRFDNSKFETNAQTTMSTLDKLKQALRFEDASKGFEGITQAASNVKMDGISTACETVSAKFSALQVAAYTALANITNEAVDAGKKIVSALTIDGAKDGFIEYEQKMGSVQTIMNSTGESLDSVMGYLEELNKYADRTIYSFSDMTSNIGKFTNAGVKLEDAVKAIQGVSNEAAVSGANAQEASRAMYNFAQALSAGYVKLIDWKSIENANMATVEFKNELLNTALALGTVEKKGELYQTITTDAKGKVSGLFDATHDFNDALKNQWMTTEVLTKTLAKYADESTDLGKKAFAAAQDVKTFSMMVDTLKEAIGSGWAISWEKFIGDFETAKKIFTNITNTISESIEKQANARNKFLDEAFNKEGVTNNSEWSKLKLTVAAAGGDMYTFKKIIIDTAKASGVAVDDLINQYGSFEESLSSGWLTSGILESSVGRIQQLGQVSPLFRDLATAVTGTDKPFRVLYDDLTAVSGRTHLLNSLTNIFEALNAVVKPVKEAFRDIFPAKTGKDLKDALGNFEEFTKKLIISSETAERVKKTFTGFFKLLASGIDTVKKIGNALSPIGDIVKIIVMNLAGGIEKLGAFFNTLDTGDEKITRFDRILQNVHDGLQSFANNLQSYIDKAKESIITFKDALVENWNTGPLSHVANIVEKIKDTLSGFGTGLSDGIKTFFKTVSEDFDGSGFEKVTAILDKFVKGIKKIATAIGNVVEPVISKLKEFVGGIDLVDTMALGIKAGGVSAIIALIGNFIDNVLDFKDKMNIFNNPVAALTDFVQQLLDLFGAIEEGIRVSVVKDFAVSVGILAASMYVLASVDVDALKAAGVAITTLIGSVIGIFVALGKISTTSSTSSNKLFAFFELLGGAITGSIKAGTLLLIAKAIEKIAISVLILAGAIKLISDIPLPQLIASFTAVSLLLAELIGVAKVLIKSEKDLVKGSSALVAMAGSLLILAAALKIISTITNENNELLDSFVALTGIIMEMIIFMKVLDKNAGIKGASSLIVMASSIMILAGALKVFENMEMEDIAKGLFTIAGLLLELGVALSLMDASLAGSAALLVASGALLVLSGALKVLENIEFEDLCKGLVVIGGLLIELGVALTLMDAALPGAAALIVAAGAFAILTPALLALSAAEPGKVFTAIGELAVALLALGGVSAILSVVSPLIVIFAAALGVLSLAILGIGVGVAAAGAGLMALATALGLLAEIGKESAERIVETLQIILNGIITMIPNMIAAFGEGIIKVCEVIVNGGPTIKAALNTIVEIIVQVFEENIPQISEAFSKMLLALMEQAEKYTPKMADSFFKLLEAILDVIAKNIPIVIQKGVDIMLAFIKGITSAQRQLINASMEAIIAFINGLADSIERYTPKLIAAVNRLFNAIVDAMLLILFNGNPKMVEKAKGLMESLKSGISSKIQEVVSIISDIVSKMIGAVSDKVEDFKEAGRNAIEGFINGVKEKVDSAVEAVKSVGGNAIDALKKKLDEHSPSKEFYKIGDYGVRGFVNAFEDGLEDVDKASSNLGQTAMDKVTEALSEGVDVNPTITPILDLSDIEKGTERINQLSGEWDNATVGVSAKLASNAALNFNKANSNKMAENQNGIELLRSVLTALNNTDTGMTQNNTFNITGNDPRVIADEVSRILQMQVERRGAVWA